jgi:hypothetical protein
MEVPVHETDIVELTIEGVQLRLETWKEHGEARHGVRRMVSSVGRQPDDFFSDSPDRDDWEGSLVVHAPTPGFRHRRSYLTR